MEKILEGLFIALVSSFIVLYVSKRIEKRRFEKQRQSDVLRRLLGRPINSPEDLTEDFVAVLNLVYIDFYGCHRVIEARKEFQKLVTRGVAAGEQTFDSEFQIQRAILLAEMAKEVGMNVSEIDIMHGHYYPRHFFETLEKKKNLEDARLKFFRGQQPISVISSDQESIRILHVLMNLNFLSDEEKRTVKNIMRNGPTRVTPNRSESLITKGILEFNVETEEFSIPLWVLDKIRDDPRFK
jgi:hypothetical protein